MTLTDKFRGLTPGQREKFNALKDSVGLEAFLFETGLELTVEEKAQVLEYIVSGKLSLADEELDNVAGGGCLSGSSMTCPKCGSTNVKKISNLNHFNNRYRCFSCDYSW